MNLAELKEAYKARKLALDSAKKEEEKYKALLKDAMLEAGESDYTDEAGYRFERIVQERKSMDEEKLLAELHERNLTSCIATKEVVDEDATLKAVEAGELPQEVLADALKVTEVVMLKLTAPKKARLCFGCDLAISEKEQDKGDYFVLMVIGVDADHNVYVLDYVKERLTFNTQLNTIIDYGRNKFPMVERIGVETVAYQKSLAQELRRLSLLPIININTSKDKVTRAMRRSANFENHKVYFREGMDDLEECLLLFPEVDHDDLFDALLWCIRTAPQRSQPIRSACMILIQRILRKLPTMQRCTALLR